jgi:polyisoprenoid-binding protein YceI
MQTTSHLRVLFALRLAVGVAALSAVAVPNALATALDVKASGEKTFYVYPRAGSSQVTIFSRSVLEDFTIVCNRVSGQWEVDPKNLEALRGRFAMRVNDMYTGIDLRDRDMRGPNWFDAARYPEITVDVSRVTDVRKASPNTATMNLVGVCSMHGRSNPVSIPCTLAYLDESPATTNLVKGDVLRIRAEFVIRLSDYGITGPPASEMIGVTVSNDQDIKVTIFGATGKPPAELAADQEPGAGGATTPSPPPTPP